MAHSLPCRLSPPVRSIAPAKRRSPTSPATADRHRAQLHLTYQPDSATLTVSDHRDDAEERAPLLPDTGSGYGLSAMRERITLLGGTLTAGPTGDGWRVEVKLPR